MPVLIPELYDRLVVCMKPTDRHQPKASLYIEIHQGLQSLRKRVQKRRINVMIRTRSVTVA